VGRAQPSPTTIRDKLTVGLTTLDPPYKCPGRCAIIVKHEQSAQRRADPARVVRRRPEPAADACRVGACGGRGRSAALLIRSRILRRVIKQDRRLTGFGLRVPHRKSYTIGREPLLEIVDRAELGLADDAPLPEKVVLLARPEPQKLAVTPPTTCWSAIGGSCSTPGHTWRWTS